MSSDKLKVIWSAIFLGQEGLAVVELARRAAGALRGVGAVEVRGMTVSNIAEPKGE